MRRRKRKVEWFAQGNDQTLQQFSRDRRDEELANQSVDMELARKKGRFIDSLMFILGKGPSRDLKRMELNAEMNRLGLQCEAFKTAIHALLATERQKTQQFKALCRALPHMQQEEHKVAVEILSRLATVTSNLPAPQMPLLERKTT